LSTVGLDALVVCADTGKDRQPVGLLAAVALGRMIEHRLRNVAGGDPWILVISVSVLFGVTVLACAAPAWRASMIDPAITLRQE